MLELLVEHGLVERVAVGPGSPATSASIRAASITIIWCVSSAGVWSPSTIPGLERAIHRVSARLGARVEHHEVMLRGACADCG